MAAAKPNERQILAFSIFECLNAAALFSSFHGYDMIYVLYRAPTNVYIFVERIVLPTFNGLFDEL